MSKSAELHNIRCRNISGDREIGGEGFTLFSVIAAPDSVAFAERLETESELAQRRRYCGAFLYGLKKVLPMSEYKQLCEGLKNKDGKAKGISPTTAAIILANRYKFARIKQLYPWCGVTVFERRFFQRLQAVQWRYEKKLKSYRLMYAADPEKFRERNRLYKKANRQKINAQNRAKYATDPEKFRARNRLYIGKNREQIYTRRRANYAKNIDEKRAGKRRYYAANSERCKAAARKWKEKHREELKTKNKEWREKNKERAREYNRMWRESNREKVKAYQREYQRTYREKMRKKRESEKPV